MNSTEEMMLDENELDSISKLAYELHHEWPEISLAEMELATNEGLWVIFNCVFEYSYNVKVRRSWRFSSELTKEKNYTYEEDVEVPVVSSDVALELIGAKANSDLTSLAYCINEHFGWRRHALPSEHSSSSCFDPLKVQNLEKIASRFEESTIIGRSIVGYEGNEQVLSSVKKRRDFQGAELPNLDSVIFTSSPKFMINGQPIADEKIKAYLLKASETFPEISSFE